MLLCLSFQKGEENHEDEDGLGETDEFDIDIKVSDPEKVGKYTKLCKAGHSEMVVKFNKNNNYSCVFLSLGDGMGAFMQYQVKTTVTKQ